VSIRSPTTWPEVPPAVRFDEGLRQLVPWTPVTTALVLINVVVFFIMAIRYGRMLEFNTHILMGWGAAYGPRALGGQWWRLVACTFLHGGLLHLFGNVWFLLMAGRLVERLLGRFEFLLVYLFAGVGAALAGMAWFPSAVLVGASGAVFGIYGALLGCYLRGRAVIPWQVLGRHTGLLLFYAAFSLLHDHLALKEGLIAHAGGALCGFVGGLALGPVLCPRRELRRRWRLPVAVVLCVGLTWLAAWGATSCTRRTIARLTPLDTAIDWERELLASFDDALRRWEDGNIDDKKLAEVLRKDLIPEWKKMRAVHKLELPRGQQGPVLQELRNLPMKPNEERKGSGRKRKPLSDKELGELFRIYVQARVESWEELANGLAGKGLSLSTATDLVIVEVLRERFDELVNEGNPLHNWLEFSKSKIRKKKQSRGRPQSMP
jgi:membrane associated rhomboid family serine protease